MNQKKVFLLVVSIITGGFVYLFCSNWIPGLEKGFANSSGFWSGFFLVILRILLYIFFSTFLLCLIKIVIKLKPLDFYDDKGLIGGMIAGFWMEFIGSLVLGFFLLILEISSSSGKTWSLELIVLLKITLAFSLGSGLLLGLKNELTTFPKKLREEK